MTSGSPSTTELDTAGGETAPHQGFLDRLATGTLAYQRCRGCASAVFPPRVLCPACGNAGLAWQVSDGRGSVYSTSVLSPRDGEPYTVVLVDLDEGFRMMSTVVRTPAAQVRIGMRVQALPEPEHQRVVFVAAEDQR